MKKTILALAAIIALPAAANATAFTNGSFELGTAPGSFTQLSVGAANITGWSVVSGTIDYIGSYWQAGAGSRSVDMSGTSAGSISQTFDTVLGKTYTVDFLMAGNPDGGSASKVLKVSATGNSQQSFNFNTNGKTKSAMGWTSKSYQFTATGTSTTLNFLAVGSGSYGTALDGITVTSAVPEPASWAMMIGGFGIAGGAMRRRTRSTLAFG